MSETECGRNRRMFYEIAEIIEEHPDMHDQGIWTNLQFSDEYRSTVVHHGEEISCGTTQCVAGWAVVLDRKRKVFETTKNFNAIDFPGLGAEILGLSTEEAEILFYSGNKRVTPEALRKIGDGMDVEEALGPVETYECDCGCGNTYTLDY